MRIEPIRDRARIEAFLRRDAPAHVYALADLDEPFWPDTRWFAALGAEDAEARDGDGIQALCLRLDGLALPIVYAVCPPGHLATAALLRAIGSELPDRFFYNLGPGLAASLEGFTLEPVGTYHKMILGPDLDTGGGWRAVPGDGVEPLGPDRLDELQRFLEHDAYLEGETGGLFFEPRMLETGCYRGIREHGALVAVGGVHVHSRRMGVGALGNVATRPDARGRGLATRISAAVVRALRADTPTIGLNVHEDNAPARRCYTHLGFEPVCAYEEGVATRA